MNKLRERFLSALGYFGRFDVYFEQEKEAEQCEQITNDFSVKFAEWLQENRWFSFTDGKWNYTFEQGTAMSKTNYDKNYRKTTTELLQIFKTQVYGKE